MTWPIVDLALGVAPIARPKSGRSELIQVIGSKLTQLDFNSLIVQHLHTGLEDAFASAALITKAIEYDDEGVRTAIRDRLADLDLDDLPRGLIRARVRDYYRVFARLGFEPAPILVIVAEIQHFIIDWCIQNAELLAPYSPWSDEAADETTGNKDTTSPPTPSGTPFVVAVTLDPLARSAARHPSFTAYLAHCQAQIRDRLQHALALSAQLPAAPPLGARLAEFDRELERISRGLGTFSEARTQFHTFLSEFYVATALRLLDLEKLDSEKRAIAQELTRSSESISNRVNNFEQATKHLAHALARLSASQSSLRDHAHSIVVHGLSYITSIRAFVSAYEHYVDDWHQLLEVFEHEKRSVTQIEEMVADATDRAEELLL